MSNVIPKDTLLSTLQEYEYKALQQVTARNAKDDLNQYNYDVGRINAYRELANWVANATIGQ